MSCIYYAVAHGEVTAQLPENLIEHAKTPESVWAWSLLFTAYQKVYGEKLPTVIFNERGKPLIDGGYISLSHSKGAVAVCFSKTQNCGVDIELIKAEIPTKTAELMKVEPLSPETFYTAFTQRESVIKALSKSILSRDINGLFTGESSVVNFGEKKYSLSLYGIDCKFIKVTLN